MKGKEHKIRALERITKNEKILDSAFEKIDALKRAIAGFLEYQSEIKELEDYYSCEDWKNDLALDEAGELPPDLKRGVLSEDGIYNVLERNKELLELIGGSDDKQVDL